MMLRGHAMELRDSREKWEAKLVGALRQPLDAARQRRGRIAARHRPGEMKALDRGAADLRQDIGLRLGLDALGDDLEVERHAELDDQLDDRAGPGVAADIVDERLVDLDRVDRIAVDIA